MRGASAHVDSCTPTHHYYHMKQTFIPITNNQVISCQRFQLRLSVHIFHFCFTGKFLHAKKLLRPGASKSSMAKHLGIAADRTRHFKIETGQCMTSVTKPTVSTNIKCITHTHTVQRVKFGNAQQYPYYVMSWHKTHLEK